MLKKIIGFYRALPPAERPVSLTDEEAVKLTKKLRLQSFFAGALGYSLYYVCRTGLNVVKTPIVESGMLNDQQLGIVGSALLFAYAIGKFVNSFMADHSNIKRFMATGLIVSSVANLIVGLLGMTSGLAGLSSMAFFCLLFYYVGDKRLVSIDGGWSCHYCIISLVSAERARNLLWIFQCQS